MYKTTADFYLSHEEPAKSCLLALRGLLLKFDSAITEGMKYGMPVFYFKGKTFCYLWTDKKTREPYILMVEGGKLAHPALETGDRKRMKILPINASQDIPVDTVYQVLKEAAGLYD